MKLLSRTIQNVLQTEGFQPLPAILCIDESHRSFLRAVEGQVAASIIPMGDSTSGGSHCQLKMTERGEGGCC